MNKYDISIIIPVYNNEKYIDKCLKSVLKQTFDINRIQVLLLNDGSTDKSLEILKKYESKNIQVIDKKNSGVSDTRNQGIKKALGKYIMFLDSDDYISRNTCKHLYNLFEKHYDEIDLITYPIIYNKNGKYNRHPRYTKLYKGTGIYDLDKQFNLIQTTVNIFIKNEFKDNELFDINQNFSEDERYATEILMKKRKIGFCREAIYFYRRHANTANDTIKSPYYSFETIMKYYEYLFKKYEKNGVPKYIQALFVNNISWRIKDDALLPYHYEKKEYDKAVNRIKELLKKVDVDVITSLPYAKLHQMYILNLASKKIDVVFSNNNYSIKCDNVILEEQNSIKSIINRCKIKNNKIILNGYLETFLFEKNKPELYLKTIDKNNKENIKEIHTYISNNSYYMSKIKTNNLYGYDLNIDVNNLKQFEMYINIDNIKIPIKFSFGKFSSNIIYNKNTMIKCNSKIFEIKRNSVICKIGQFIKNSFVKNYRLPFILLNRINYLFYIKTKKVWLYNDKETLLDNAYMQFIHDIKKNDGIKKYYVYNGSLDKIKDKFSKEDQKYLIKYKSLKHRRLFLHSDKIITSFADLQVYCPFADGIKFYKDIKNYDLIYLQHGILHADLLTMYSKEFTEIDKIAISTNFEKENLINKYHYNELNLMPYGMPRMNIINNNEVKNKILFAPSWRSYLIGSLINNKRGLKEKVFLNSTFYKEINRFLNSKELQEYLKENNLELEFKLHPIFKEYQHLFNIKNANISMNFDKINISDYKIFITDFSSFQFDFVKLKRPIIYFMPDMTEFKAGLHTYKNLDLKYEDAFGNLCLTSEELIKEMKKITKNNYNADRKYLDRMNSFFLDIDNSTEKIYKDLKEL